MLAHLLLWFYRQFSCVFGAFGSTGFETLQTIALGTNNNFYQTTVKKYLVIGDRLQVFNKKIRLNRHAGSLIERDVDILSALGT